MRCTKKQLPCVPYIASLEHTSSPPQVDYDISSSSSSILPELPITPDATITTPQQICEQPLEEIDVERWLSMISDNIAIIPNSPVIIEHTENQNTDATEHLPLLPENPPEEYHLPLI